MTFSNWTTSRKRNNATTGCLTNVEEAESVGEGGTDSSTMGRESVVAYNAPASWREVKMFLEVELELNDEWQAALTVRIFRTVQWLFRRRAATAFHAVGWKLWNLIERIWINAVLGADIPAALECGLGVRFAHGGRGVVLHPYVRIGQRCTIYHRVTAGIRGLEHEAPVIGNDVTLGTGCVVVGPVAIGHGAAVGPNAVVVSDVAERTHVVAAAATVLDGSITLANVRSTASGRMISRIGAPRS